VPGDPEKSPSSVETTFAGVAAGRNTKDVTWMQTWQSAPVSLILGAQPGPEADKTRCAGGIEQRSRPDHPACFFSYLHNIFSGPPQVHARSLSVRRAILNDEAGKSISSPAAGEVNPLLHSFREGKEVETSAEYSWIISRQTGGWIRENREAPLTLPAYGDGVRL
jgi:hypothetical protein